MGVVGDRVRPGDEIQLDLMGPDHADRIPPRITVVNGEGAWTPGPHAVLEAGTEMELTLEELQWLRDKGLPAAIQKLSEIQATGG